MSDHEMNVGASTAFTGAASNAIPHNLGEQTRKVVADVQHKAGEQVRSGLDSGKRRAAGALLGVADSLMHGSATEQSGAGQYIRQAGEQVQRAADYLEKADVKQLTRDAESFARRQPIAFIGGAFVLGVVAARFFKSSQQPDGAKDMSDNSRMTQSFSVPVADGPLADQGPERGGWYEGEQPVNRYREPLPPTLGE
ncbi:hypothetical protein [Gemmatimonas groenlandica]|uniref:Uncharacterized protein n=1 Tax=Gemmatimonas groenlandica TaxID=2732249 RepID=A0A6M4IJY3_9BACT|nr:hypothetical protein [Gemmatimonas groenlandica]QJR34158.1 hypothetical protein HKW67_00830 [Gemmatimonas groenlandica]